MGLRHDAHYLEDDLAAKIKRHLDKSDNRQLYDMLKAGDPFSINRVAQVMLDSLGKDAARRGKKWMEASVAWPIPGGCFQPLATRIQELFPIAVNDPEVGIFVAARPVDEDLFVLTLTLKKGTRAS